MIIRYASAAMTLAGILALLSGLLFWTGSAMNLVTMHMLLGLLTVAALWAIAIAQAFSPGGSWPIAASAVIVGGLTIYIGVNQAAMMPGERHWLIQVLHLVLGILTIGLGHMAAARYRRAGKGS